MLSIFTFSSAPELKTYCTNTTWHKQMRTCAGLSMVHVIYLWILLLSDMHWFISPNLASRFGQRNWEPSRAYLWVNCVHHGIFQVFHHLNLLKNHILILPTNILDCSWYFVYFFNLPARNVEMCSQESPEPSSSYRNLFWLACGCSTVKYFKSVPNKN